MCIRDRPGGPGQNGHSFFKTDVKIAVDNLWSGPPAPNIIQAFQFDDRLCSNAGAWSDDRLCSTAGAWSNDRLCSSAGAWSDDRLRSTAGARGRSALP